MDLDFKRLGEKNIKIILRVGLQEKFPLELKFEEINSGLQRFRSAERTEEDKDNLERIKKAINVCKIRLAELDKKIKIRK